MKADADWCVKREFKCYQAGQPGLIVFSFPGGGPKEILIHSGDFISKLTINSHDLSGKQETLLPC